MSREYKITLTIANASEESIFDIIEAGMDAAETLGVEFGGTFSDIGDNRQRGDIFVDANSPEPVEKVFVAMRNAVIASGANIVDVKKE